jgi:hypothetical protein
LCTQDFSLNTDGAKAPFASIHYELPGEDKNALYKQFEWRGDHKVLTIACPLSNDMNGSLSVFGDNRPANKIGMLHPEV